jgi:rhodanese-related sulfurtransferase
MIDLSSEELIEKLKNDDKGCLLDVRSEEEFEESHIPNAKLLNIRNPQSFMDGLERMDLIIFLISYYLFYIWSTSKLIWQ